MAEKRPGRPEVDIFGNSGPRVLDDEGAAQKRAIYEAMSARGKKYVNSIGFDAWDPFQEPKEPLDIRKDVTRRTTRDLIRAFLRERTPEGVGNTYGQGALECALGIVNKDERIRGMYDFCLWYETLVRRESNGGNDEGPV